MTQVPTSWLSHLPSEPAQVASVAVVPCEMEYTGPGSLANIEADLALSDDDALVQEHWPRLVSYGHRQMAPVSPPSQPMDFTNASAKRRIENDSDSNSDLPSPATKATKSDTALPLHAPTDRIPSRSAMQNASPPPPPSPASLAFAPRADYVKLQFRGNPGVDVKLRWLSEVVKMFGLDRELAEVKMAAVTSSFVYISRRRQDIIDRVKDGAVLSLFLDVQDSVERPRKFPTYLITRFPIAIEPSLAKELSGVYSVRRFLQNGVPINRLVITWSLPDPPPSHYNFSFLPCLPSCELRKMPDEQPWCFKCWGIGHISRYCTAREKCAWCSAEHDSRSCPHRAPAVTTVPPSASTSSTATPNPSTPDTPNPPPPDKSQWKCPRCQLPGVNVWHGCAKRVRLASSAHDSPPPPPPPPTDAASRQVVTLHEAVESLKSQCLSLASRVAVIETRLDSVEARFDSLMAAVDTLSTRLSDNDTTLKTLVEAQQANMASTSALATKFESFATRLEKVIALTVDAPSRGPTGRNARPSPAASSSPRENRNNVR